jgi:hypothetical protein
MILQNNDLVEIFYSYAPQDDELQQQLEKHLGNLKRQGKIAGWCKRDIDAGQAIEDELSSYLNRAHIILLLISPDFIASDECWNKEMDRALERQKTESTLVIPILLRPTDYQDAPFSNLRVLPRNGKPVTSWTDYDEAFASIVQDIRLLAEGFKETGRISWKKLGFNASIGAGIGAAVVVGATLVRRRWKGKKKGHS